MDQVLTNKSIKERFMYIESSQIPLTEIPWVNLKETIIDPVTRKPYIGIILEGCFADLSNKKANNNNRFYDIPRYLELLKILKKQIHSGKGVYGELEHPESYAINYNNVSHKLLDVWWDEKEQKVNGRLIILNTEKGKIAQEIIKSGGQLAISARAAGEENSNPDGTKSAITKLLTTYDLVYHPGFSSAVLEFKELNESQKFLTEVGKNKKGFSGVLYEKDFKKMPEMFASFISLNETVTNKCFLEWLFESELEKQIKVTEQKIIEKNETNNQQDIEKELEIATKQDLSEAKNNFIFQTQQAQKILKNKKDKAYYDNSAGFIDNSLSLEN